MKLQSFFVLKFSSDRLKEDGYEIEITLNQARENGEVIRLGDSELLRAIRRIKGIVFDPDALAKLEKQKKKIKSKPNNKDNQQKLKEIDQEIDSILYVPELVNVTFSDSRHYKKIIDAGGLIINGIRYVRLLAGAGMTRRSTVMFCSEEIFENISRFLNNGRRADYKINPSKWNAYYALASSATIPVSMPRFCVVPDCKIDKPVKVDFMIENGDGIDPTIEEKEIINNFNLFDGQGLVSPSLSAQWANEVEIDWLPSAWIFRGAFLKGLLITFDFHALAKANNISSIQDVYGNTHNVDDIDAIISVSQFKLWNAYSSTDEYIEVCKSNQFGWGISRYSPKKDKKYAFTTYQYIQNLDINTEDQITGICQKTVDWISGVTGEDWAKAVLYLMGEIDKEEVGSGWFDSLTDNILKSLLIDQRLINEKYVRQHIVRMINKKIIESYMGTLLLEANYQFMISDPFAQAQHALGLSVTGLLAEKEHYSQYWNKRKTFIVSAVRSPMTWRSENNVLHLKQNDDLDYWYQYLYSGIVFNVHGIDAMSMSGADYDGDICMTTAQKEFIKGQFPNVLPPTYDRKSAQSKFIEESELWEYDEKTFRSKIGLVTNIGTNFFAMLPLFDKDSKEYRSIIDRIKVCNCLQSMEIDRAKGIQTMPMPKWWTSWSKKNDEMTEEEIERADYYNSILCDKRPYFFRYLYPERNKEYEKHLAIYDNYCYAKFNMSILELIAKSDRSEYEEKIVGNYYKRNPLLDSDCVLNNVSHHMEKEVKEIKLTNRKSTIKIDEIFGELVIDAEKLKKLRKIYEEFRTYNKSTIGNDVDYMTFDQIISALRRKANDIDSNGQSLARMAISINMKFAYSVFGDDIIKLLLERNNNIIQTPVVDENGSIEYLGEKYSIFNMSYRE